MAAPYTDLAAFICTELEDLRDEIYMTWHPINRAVTLKVAGEDALCQVADLLDFAAQWDATCGKEASQRYAPLTLDECW